MAGAGARVKDLVKRQDFDAMSRITPDFATDFLVDIVQKADLVKELGCSCFRPWCGSCGTALEKDESDAWEMAYRVNLV